MVHISADKISAGIGVFALIRLACHRLFERAMERR
jgi:hypothetical protein